MPITPETLATFYDAQQRSMLGGVSTAEYNAALKGLGFDPTTDNFAWYDGTKALQAAGYETGAPSAEYIKKYGPTIAATGVGNMSYSPGFSLGDRDPALQAAGYDNYYDQALKKPSTSYLQKQILDLQNSYKDLLAKSTRGTTGTTGTTTTTGGVAADTGGTTIDTSNSGAGTSGVVYGPDGKMYSSAAAAIAAGVTNYTRTKPVGAIAGADNLSGSTAARGFMSNDSQVGNVNTGGLIANQSQQLFNVNPNVKLPTGVPNPFSV